MKTPKEVAQEILEGSDEVVREKIGPRGQPQWENRRHRERVGLVNDHRRAVGRKPFKYSITRAEVSKHMRLINKHAPHGNDPWRDED